MRSVLCFGDSNTYGQIPGEGPLDRYGPSERWPGVLRDQLGPGWLVIEEGLAGRTTVNEDPVEGADKNGRSYFRPCLQSHAGVDLIVIMLGTNDLKVRFAKPASEVAMGIGVLVHDVKELLATPDGRFPEILVVAPPPMLEELFEWSDVFSGGPEKSRQLALQFERLADNLELHFFDASSVSSCSPIDGIHLDAEAHRSLGVAIAEEITLMGLDASQPDARASSE